MTCRADSIPEHIEIDCSTLEIGDNIHIDDITLPEGAEVTHEVNFTIINLAAPKKAEPEPEAVTEEGAEAAGEEGAEAAGEDSTEASED